MSFNMFRLIRRYKGSFSLIELGVGIAVSGVLTGTTVAGMSVVNNAKVAKLVQEIQYYDMANTQFISTYNALPGLITNNNCVKSDKFSNACRTAKNINITTSDNMFSNSSCSKLSGCKIETSGKAGAEDIINGFLTPMRYLQAAGLIEQRVQYGLNQQLPTNSDYSTKVWAKSQLEDNIYINIYNYSTSLGYKKGDSWLFTGQYILGHTTHSGNWQDHYNKLQRPEDQYLIYHRNSSIPKGALSNVLVKNVDAKIDDGKPLTGRLTVYATTNGDFKNNEYSKCITEEPTDEGRLHQIEYSEVKGGACNISYKLYGESLSDSNSSVKSTYIDPKTFNNCFVTSDGTTKCKSPEECYVDTATYKKICTYTDEPRQAEFTPTCELPLPSKRVCTYPDGSIFEQKLNGYCTSDQIDSAECDSILKSEHRYYCTDGVCIGTTSLYCADDKAGTLCYTTKQTNSTHKCDTLNSYSNGQNCTQLELNGYCTGNTSSATCTSDITTSSTYYCVNSSCTGTSTGYCPSSDIGTTCTSYPADTESQYKCTTLNNLVLNNCSTVSKQSNMYCGNSGCFGSKNDLPLDDASYAYPCSVVDGKKVGSCSGNYARRYCCYDARAVQRTYCCRGGNDPIFLKDYCNSTYSVYSCGYVCYCVFESNGRKYQSLPSGSCDCRMIT